MGEHEQSMEMDFLDRELPPMTYRNLFWALEQVATEKTHQALIPHLVSGLWRHSPFLTGQMLMFEIVRTGNCVADVALPTRPD